MSCISAAAVLGALDRDNWDVVPVGITADGRWVLPAADPAAIPGQLPTVVGSTEIALVGRGYQLVGAPAVPAGIDLAFPLLHGPFGEDGTVQGLLEMMGIPYVGSGVFASAAAMDKEHMKTLLVAAGLPVGPYAVVRPGQEVALPGPGPWFVKPARGGSSRGISKVGDPADLPAALARARVEDPKVLIEAAVSGREIECGVLDGDPPAASRPAEIHVRGREFYDFEAKYLEDSTRFDVPARLTAGQESAVRAAALAAFRALDCAGLARVDFFLRPGGELVVNEVNTMPGFTTQSMFPRMWQASGLEFTPLLDRLLALAASRGTGLR